MKKILLSLLLLAGIAKAGPVVIWGTNGGISAAQNLTTKLCFPDNNCLTSASGTGDVVGPASSVASEIALFDGVTGKLLKRATGSGVCHVASGVYSASSIVNADVDASAAIAVNKLAALTASRAVKTDASGFLAVSTATSASLDALSGTNTGDQTITLSGDISGSGTSGITTAIGANKVSNAMLAQIATARFKGRTTAGTGDVEDLTATQATALLNNFVGDSGSGGTKGLVPAPASGDAAAAKFLKADGTWTAPASSGDVVGPGSATDNALVRFDSTTGKLIQNNTQWALDDNGGLAGTVTSNMASPVLLTQTTGSTSVAGYKNTVTMSSGTGAGGYFSFNSAVTMNSTSTPTVGSLVSSISDNGASASGSVLWPLYITGTINNTDDDWIGLNIAPTFTSVNTAIGIKMAVGTTHQALNIVSGHSDFFDNVTVDGVADEIQLNVQAHSTQTSNIFNAEKSDGTDLLSVTNTGGTLIRGTTTNDNAATGFVGEYVESVVAVTNFPTAGQYGDLTSISLTAGDWDVSAFISATANGSTFTDWYIGISTTSGNSATGLVVGSNFSNSFGATAAYDSPQTIPGYRMSLSGTTTVYLKYRGGYSVATPKAAGRLSARRMR